MCACGRVCVLVCKWDELNFMLYSSCGYGGIHIGNESWMNLVEVGNIGIGRVVYGIGMEMD